MWRKNILSIQPVRVYPLVHRSQVHAQNILWHLTYIRKFSALQGSTFAAPYDPLTVEGRTHFLNTYLLFPTLLDLVTRDDKRTRPNPFSQSLHRSKNLTRYLYRYFKNFCESFGFDTWLLITRWHTWCVKMVTTAIANPIFHHVRVFLY